MKRAIVIGCDVMGLGVIRAFHLKKIPVIALHYEKTDFAHTSRYTEAVYEIPHPSKEEAMFVDFFLGKTAEWKGSLLIDTNDFVAVTLSKYKRLLGDYYKIPTPNWEVLRKFIEKKETCQLAAACKIPHPRTLLPKTFSDLDKIKDRIYYPCILKPVRSHQFKQKFRRKNFFVADEKELRRKFHLCSLRNEEVMIQEIIPGSDEQFFKMQAYVNSRGQLTSRFFLGKIRSNPHPFGFGRVVMSKPFNPQVEQLTQKLLQYTNYRGFLSIEFKMDPRDKQLKLIELNSRMVRNNWLSTYCGINYPWLIYMDLVQQKRIDIRNYRTNVYWIEWHSDLFNSIFRFHREKIRIKDYLRPYFSRRRTFAVFSSEDPLPFLKQSLLLSKKFMSRI